MPDEGVYIVERLFCPIIGTQIHINVSLLKKSF